MCSILVSGLVNFETTARVRGFPIVYYPIDYPFFGVNSAVSGVGYNLAKALHTLGDQVRLFSMIGNDDAGFLIQRQLLRDGLDDSGLCPCLEKTAASVVLYDEQGNRQIYCDLKDVQQRRLDFSPCCLEGVDLVAACNINFNRPLLHLARQAGKTVATDVHVLSDVYDEYNREFLENAQIVFLSDEAIGEDYKIFLRELSRVYGMEILVLGRGSHGAAMLLRNRDEILEFPAFNVGPVVNTVGAGDALFSAFIHYYARGFAPERALAAAQLFASYKIGTSGAALGFATGEEMEHLLTRYRV